MNIYRVNYYPQAKLFLCSTASWIQSAGPPARKKTCKGRENGNLYKTVNKRLIPYSALISVDEYLTVKNSSTGLSRLWIGTSTRAQSISASAVVRRTALNLGPNAGEIIQPE